MFSLYYQNKIENLIAAGIMAVTLVFSVDTSASPLSNPPDVQIDQSDLIKAHLIREGRVRYYHRDCYKTYRKSRPHRHRSLRSRRRIPCYYEQSGGFYFEGGVRSGRKRWRPKVFNPPKQRLTPLPKRFVPPQRRLQPLGGRRFNRR